MNIAVEVRAFAMLWVILLPITFCVQGKDGGLEIACRGIGDRACALVDSATNAIFALQDIPPSLFRRAQRTVMTTHVAATYNLRKRCERQL